MTDEDDRSSLVTLASGAYSGRQLLLDADEHRAAVLLHGLLSMYEAAMRETCTELGVLALGVMLEEITEDSYSYPEHQEAARLILAHNAARTPDAEGAFCEFGADAFNEVIERVNEAEGGLELTLAVAAVWRRLMPHLHTRGGGLEILRRVEW